MTLGGASAEIRRKARMRREPMRTAPTRVQLSWGRELRQVEYWPLAARLSRAEPKSRRPPFRLRQWLMKLLFSSEH